MSKWWVTGLALLIFAAVGCDVAATVLTSREVAAIDDNEPDATRLHNQGQLRRLDLNDGESPDPSKLSDQILTPFVVPESENRTGANGDSLSVQGSDPAVVSNETVSAGVRYETKPVPANPDEHISRFPDVTLTIEPTPTLALVPTPHEEESTTREAPRAGPSVAGGEVASTPEPNQGCIRPGDMVLWLEPSGGEWTVPVGQSIEVNLCLSNLSTDLAGFDLALNLGRSGVAEFTRATIGGFGLESHSELPTESLRVRAIDLKQQLNAGTRGILLATLWIAGAGVGESPLTIEINAIDDKDGYSVKAQALQASLQVTEG